jgi:DNA-binding response OmpR family regulator
MAKILVVEDDKELSGVIEDQLRFDHHTVQAVGNGGEALHLLQFSAFDLVILDWGLPDLDGIQILTKYRSRGGTTPILMLTGRGKAVEKEQGLDSGADDYLTKPFEIIELSARVRALLRRPAQLKEDILRFEDIDLDLKSFRLIRAGKEIPLTPKEFSVMEFFMRHPGQIFSLEAILERVWRSDDKGSLEGVRSCIKRLREKLDAAGQPSFITSVHGFGYKLAAPE